MTEPVEPKAAGSGSDTEESQLESFGKLFAGFSLDRRDAAILDEELKAFREDLKRLRALPLGDIEPALVFDPVQVSNEP